MDAFEQVTRDMREFAIEVKRLGYSLPDGCENRFVELSERMIKHTDDLARSHHQNDPRSRVPHQHASVCE
jgi:hypothetical protein